MHKLPRSFYAQNTITVAKALLGHHLVHRTDLHTYIGKIVEIEAYLGAHDLACHASKGITNRTKIMYGAPGHAYIYLIYGMHHCLNAVTEPEGHGSAVLIRAIEPMQAIEKRTNGPGLLCRAMEITRDLNGVDLLGDTLFITDDFYNPPTQIMATSRIGVAYAKEWREHLLRFYIADNPFVSGKKSNSIIVI